MQNLTVPEFMQRLPELDAAIAAKVKLAKAKGCELRCVGRELCAAVTHAPTCIGIARPWQPLAAWVRMGARAYPRVRGLVH